MKKKLIMLSLALISCVCVMSGAAACSYDDEGNVTDVHIHDVPLTYVDAVDATCTTAGNIAYYTCESCGKYFADYDATTELSESDVVVAALGHDYTTTFSWAEDYSTATATRVCSHDSTHTETVTAVITSDTTAATCTEAGSITYTATATFSDTKTATDTKTDTLPATDHTYSTEWTTNSSSHWRVCTACGARTDVADHTFTATDSKASCSVCGTVANESLTLEADKTLTLINSGTDDNGNYVTYSYLAYYASEAGEYSLELVAGNNSPILSMIGVVVSVNGTVVTGSDSVYTVELAAGTNNIEIALTGTATVDPASENYTYTATLSAYVPLPTLSMGANTVSEEVTYEFTATDAGYYTFTVSGTKGWAYLYSADNLWDALYEEYYSDVNYYYTYLEANEVFALYVENGGDGDFVITITYSEGNPDPNAVTTSVPATLELGDNAIALSSSDCDANLSSTFTATEAGTYTFSISGSGLGYASLVYKYTPSNRAIQVVYSDDPQLYTLEAGESITIYFYADNEAEYTFNIAFGDYVTTDDDYLKTGDYTIETTYDADYNYYGYKAVYIIKTTGTYTFTLDTTATTGSEVIYFSNDGTLHDCAAELSLSGTTTASYELTAGNSIYIYIYEYGTEAANTYVFNISLEGEEAPCEHSYEATWAWADDNTATVELVCSLCGDKQTVEATVTTETTEATCTVDGLTTYTATATYNGVEYTDTDTETIVATGHSYTAAWTWASGYSSADLTLTCGACGYKQTFTATSASASETDSDGVTNTAYTVSYIYEGETYTDTKQISIYNMSSLSGSVKTGDELFGGFITAYTTSTTSSSVTFTRYDRSGASTVPALVEGTQYEGVVLTHCIRISGSTSNERGIQFTLSEDATVFIYYTINSTSGCLILTGDGGTYTITSATGVNTDIYMYEVRLTKGTYKLYTITSGQYDLYSIIVDYNASTGTDSGDTCEHTYEASWAWASDYSSATLTLTCSLCDYVQTFTVDSSSTTDDNGNTVYTVSYTYEGETYTKTETVLSEDGYFVAGTYTVEPTLDEDYDDYRYSFEYTVKETGTYTIALDTTATTGSGTLYFSLDGTLHTLAAELSADGTTSAVCDLNAGGTIIVLLYSDADAYKYVFTVTYSELCDHSYTDVWTWAENYTTADVTLTCSNCGMVITATVEPTSATADGYIVYTASYTYNYVTYTESKSVEVTSSNTFNGTIYDISGSGDITVGTVINDGFTVIGSSANNYLTYYTGRSTTLVSTDTYDCDTNGNTPTLTTALGSWSTLKGLSFTLSTEATVVLWYSCSNTSYNLRIKNSSSTVVASFYSTSGDQYDVYVQEVTLSAGTYTLVASGATSMGTAYLYAIGISDNALYVVNTDTLLTLEDGKTWDSEVGTTGAYVYNSTDYELTGGTEYTLTVKDSGSYTFTTGNSDVTFGTTTIGANTSVTLDLYADEEYTVTAVSDVTLTAQFIDVTGNAYGTYDDTSAEYTFTEYSGSVTLAADDTVYYRIDAASQDADGNTSFNMYIYVSGDVDNVSVYYSNTKDSGEDNIAAIAAKDSYTLVTLTEGYYYITLAAKGHGFFKIVANSAATITVTLAEGGDGGDDSGDSGDSGITYVAMTLGETMTLDLLDDGNGYYVVYLSYTAGKAGDYTLTLSGDHSWWTSGLAMITDGLKVTVNDGTAETTSTGVYTISLEEGYNTIVINYSKLSSNLATNYSYTATLDGDDDSGSSSGVAMTLDETMTLDLLDDGNGYYVVYLSYTADEAGSYTLTLSGGHTMWTSSMVSYLVASITVTVNDETVSGTNGVYSLTLNEGVNTIVINYTLGSGIVIDYDCTALLEAA